LQPVEDRAVDYVLSPRLETGEHMFASVAFSGWRAIMVSV